MFKIIEEVVCVRCFQHDKNESKIVEVVGVSPEASGDKNESKIVEVDYEIPPKSEWQNIRTTYVNYFERSVFTRNPT